MGSELSPSDRELYQAVGEVIHYIWDPIGVAGVPRARDEYYSYLPHVFGLLRKGADEQAIAAYLGEITTKNMGLSANAQHDLEVAAVLVDWKNAVNEKFA